MPQSHTLQPLSMCHQNSAVDLSLRQKRTHAEWFSQSKYFRLLLCDIPCVVKHIIISLSTVALLTATNPLPLAGIYMYVYTCMCASDTIVLVRSPKIHVQHTRTHVHMQGFT